MPYSDLTSARVLCAVAVSTLPHAELRRASGLPDNSLPFHSTVTNGAVIQSALLLALLQGDCLHSRVTTYQSSNK